MKRKTRHHIIASLIGVLAIIGMLEGLFRLLDPFGLDRYMNDLAHYYSQLQEAGSLYILPDGTYHFNNWTARIRHGSRFTASPDNDCTIAFVGDSVTFGLGVNDSDVWVNRLAISFQDATLINLGLPGYNSTDVLERIQRTDADGFVYLIIPNDSQPRLQVYTTQRRSTMALQSHINFLLLREPSIGVTDTFLQDIQAMPDNVLLVGFGNEPLALAAHAYTIPMYHGRLSVADPHADAQGNIEIANHIMPFVEPFISRICRDH